MEIDLGIEGLGTDYISITILVTYSMVFCDVCFTFICLGNCHFLVINLVIKHAVSLEMLCNECSVTLAILNIEEIASGYM